MNKPRIGNAPVSWAVYEAHLPNPPYASVLDAIAASGYEGTELGPYGYLPTEKDSLARELDARHLTLGSSFVPVALEDPAAREAVIAHSLKVASLLAQFGVKELIVADDEGPMRTANAGRIPKDGSMGWTAAEWRAAIETLELIAKRVQFCVDKTFECDSCKGTIRCGLGDYPVEEEKPGPVHGNSNGTCSTCPFVVRPDGTIIDKRMATAR